MTFLLIVCEIALSIYTFRYEYKRKTRHDYMILIAKKILDGEK